MSKNEKLNLKRLLIISRPFWWVNTAVPFLVGALLATETFSVETAIGFLYFLIPYNLMMYGVNDIYDYESDVKNPRKQGLINGSVLSKSLHKNLWIWIFAINIPFILYFLINGTVASSVFFVYIIFMVFAYSQKGLRFKEIPVVDSLTSAFHYSSPFLFAILFLEGNSLWLPVFGAFFFWVVANHAFGAIQDIEPDKKAKIKSIATVLGPEKTLFFVIAMYAVAAFLPVFYYGNVGYLATIAVAPYLAIALWCFPERKNSSSKLFKSGWKFFLFLNYFVGAVATLVVINLYNS